MEFDAFLECGILAHGFLRLRCADCAHEKLVAFSCKKRGFCTSCGARRMVERARARGSYEPAEGWPGPKAACLARRGRSAKLRPVIIPSASTEANASAPDQAETPHPSHLGRMSWARLLKRVFDIDKPNKGMYRCQLLRMEQCPTAAAP